MSAGGFGNVLFCNTARESVMSHCSHMKLLSTVCPTPYKDNFQRIYKRIYTKSTTNKWAHSTIFVETCNLCCCNSDQWNKYKEENTLLNLLLTNITQITYQTYFTWIIPMDITQTIFLIHLSSSFLLDFIHQVWKSISPP